MSGHRISAKYLLTVSLVACGASYQFFNYYIVNNTQPVVTRWINSTYATKNAESLDGYTLELFWSIISSAVPFGAVFGSLLIRPLAERYGRRDSLRMAGICCATGALLCLNAKWSGLFELLIGARFLMGISVGFCSGLAPMYLTEISPKQVRGAAGTAHMIAVALGDFTSMLFGMPNFFGTDSLWVYGYALPAIPALVMTVGLGLCPESPKYLLIGKGDQKRAKQAIDSLLATSRYRNEFYEQLLEETIAAGGPGQLDNYGLVPVLRRLLSGRNSLFALCISIAAMFGQQFTGIVAVFNYSTDIFIHTGLPIILAQYCTTLLGLAYLLAVIPSTWLIEKAGRRPLLLLQLCGCTLSLLLLVLFYSVQTAQSLRWTSLASLVALIFYMLSYGLGSAIPWLVASELFSQRYRSTAVTISTFVSNILAFLVSLFYPSLQQSVGTAWSFSPFIGVLVFVLVFVYLYLPETRGRSMHEIDDQLNNLASTCPFRKRNRTSTVFPRVNTDEKLGLLNDNRQNTTRKNSYASFLT